MFADPNGAMRIIILEEAIATPDDIELSQSFTSDGVGCYTLPTPGSANEECFDLCCLSIGDLDCDISFNVLDVVTLVQCVLQENCTG